jgi:hypothetical protein
VQALPGFRRFAIEQVAGEACLVSLLRAQPALDPRDGSTNSLLQECGTTLKLVHARYGEDLASHLLSVAAPACGLPAPHMQHLVGMVREREAKDVKDALRAILMEVHAAAQGTAAG